MSQIYVGQNFKAGDVPEVFFNELKRMLEQRPEALALLEFISPGPNHRQIDCAILSPGGVDLIEIKNKHGVVRGTADGEWTVTSEWGRTERIVNHKSRQAENPYQQAYNTADDFKAGLRKLMNLGKATPSVYPMVLLPSAAPGSEVSPHSNVRLALGMQRSRTALRAFNYTSRIAWESSVYRTVPLKLGLQPVDISSLYGRVVCAETGEGVANVEVRLEDSDIILTTDQSGVYEFWAPLGSTGALQLSPPEQYLAPEPWSFDAQFRSGEVTPIRLASRYPARAVDEVRASIKEEMHSRLQEQLDAFQNSYGAMQAVIDDLTGQLSAVQIRLATQAATLTAAPPQALPSLTQRAWQATELRAIQERHQHVQDALQQLAQQRSTPDQAQVIGQSVDLLARLVLGTRHQLAAPQAQADAQATPLLVRQRTVSVSTGAEVIDAEWQTAPEATPPIQARRPFPAALLLGVAVLAAGFFVGFLTMSRSNTPTISRSSLPATINADLSDLPGVPVEVPITEKSTTPPPEVLPGEPVN